MIAIRGVLDLPLLIPLLYGDHGAAEAADLSYVLLGVLFQAIGEVLDEVGAAEGVDNIGNPAFVSQDLLCSHSYGYRTLRRRGIGFVERVCVQRLSSPQRCRQRL